MSEIRSATGRGNRWVLFDGDNTLWHIEALYDHARGELIRLVRDSGADPGEIETFQRAEDARLYKELGYSAHRFATSFENTVRHFNSDATTEQLDRARYLARRVFEQPAEVDPDAPGVLSCLRRSHRLALVTAGERWVQERRVAAFRWAPLLDVVRIVDRKTPEVFRALTEELSIDTTQSWVVGDSLRSDAIPALEAGLNAILIANHNWVEVERDERRPGDLTVVDKLGDVLRFIAGSIHEIPAPMHL